MGVLSSWHSVWVPTHGQQTGNGNARQQQWGGGGGVLRDQHPLQQAVLSLALSIHTVKKSSDIWLVFFMQFELC